MKSGVKKVITRATPGRSLVLNKNPVTCIKDERVAPDLLGSITRVFLCIIPKKSNAALLFTGSFPGTPEACNHYFNNSSVTPIRFSRVVGRRNSSLSEQHRMNGRINSH